jgi:hypothetical protein
MSIKIKFYGTEETRSDARYLECYNVNNQITMFIEDEDCSHDYNQQWISLDKPTAIRLSRELRKQIALLD